MELILLKNMDRLGKRHDVVTVKNGYGRNFLIPNKLGVIANDTNMAKLDGIKAKEASELESKLVEFRKIADTLKDNVIKIKAKAGVENKIFGSVTNLQLAQALEEQLSISLDRRSIVIEEEIKMLGTYQAKTELHPDVVAIINFEVLKD